MKECHQCKRELTNSEVYCKRCYNLAAISVIQRISETSNLDQLNTRVKFIEQNLDSINESIREILIKMMEIHRLCSKGKRMKVVD